PGSARSADSSTGARSRPDDAGPGRARRTLRVSAETRSAMVAVALAVMVAGCSTAGPRRDAASPGEQATTLGVVQKEIRSGLTQDQVVTALGSPNIVTRDGQGQETWVYDKIATEASYSSSSVYGTILVLWAGQTTGASSTSQRTLTVVIKFGSDQRVASFSYPASRF